MSDLRTAYRSCRAINAQHGRSFYRATSLLPPSRRPHVWALYAMARRSDDIVDRPVSGANPAIALRTWETAVTGAVRGEAATGDPVLAALRHTVATYDIAPRLFGEFFASMHGDLTTTTYATWDDLRGYMRGSAAAIGEMTAPVLGSGPAGLPFAAALGEAFQLTNFVRDVAEDWQRGRIYLPLEDLHSCGLDRDELGACVATGRSTGAMRRLIALEIRRARELYAAAAPGLRHVDPSCRPCLRAAVALYGAILTEVERRGTEVCQGRAVVPAARRALLVTRALAGPHARSSSATTRR